MMDHDTLATLVAQRLREIVEADQGRGLSPSGRYTPKEVGLFLGLKPWRRVYDISDVKLPRCHPTPGGRSIRFRGIDVLRFEAGLAPIDWEDVLTTVTGRARAGVRPLH